MGDSMKDDSELRQIERLITIIPDFPKPGILFRDIFPIFKQPEAVNLLMESLMAAIKGLETQIDVIAGKPLFTVTTFK
jgi:adenine phosphoribosyltransferase